MEALKHGQEMNQMEVTDKTVLQQDLKIILNGEQKYSRLSHLNSIGSTGMTKTASSSLDPFAIGLRTPDIAYNLMTMLITSQRATHVSLEDQTRSRGQRQRNIVNL